MSFILEEKSLCKKSAEEDLLLKISGTANHHPHEEDDHNENQSSICLMDVIQMNTLSSPL